MCQRRPSVLTAASREEHQSRHYMTKDKQVKDKKDFVTIKTSISTFLLALKEYWPTFIRHHQQAKLQDDAADHITNKLMAQTPGLASTVQDFSQNASLQPKFQDMTRYFSEVCVALHGTCLHAHECKIDCA